MVSRSCLFVEYVLLIAITMYLCTIHFLQCRDTFWVESFNHQLLTYLPKRVHFGSATFRNVIGCA